MNATKLARAICDLEFSIKHNGKIVERHEELRAARQYPEAAGCGHVGLEYCLRDLKAALAALKLVQEG